MLEADGVQDADPDAADDEMVMLTVAKLAKYLGSSA